MRTGRTILKFAAFGLAVVVLCFIVARISGDHSPTIDVLGSYFPAWMLCILSGLALTIVVHWIVQISKLESYLGPAPLIYSCLTIIFTFATWILVYQN